MNFTKESVTLVRVLSLLKLSGIHVQWSTSTYSTMTRKNEVESRHLFTRKVQINYGTKKYKNTIKQSLK